MTTKIPLPLCFLDARGGELARLAAAVAHSLGLSDAIALVWSDEKPMSDDVATVLHEVGMVAPHVAAFDAALTSKHSCVWLGDGPETASTPQAQVWPAALRGSNEPLFDRLVTARMLRDDIAKRLRAISKP